jgi:hypothetical protein
MKSVLHTREFETATKRGTIEYGLRYLKGNKAPYFSVTVDGREKSARGRGSDFGGCCHDLVAKVTPDLKPLIALHLSNTEGQPTHAEANGWYWLAGACGGLGEEYHGGSGKFGKSTGECEQILADHLRITANEARGLVVAALTLAETEGVKSAREMFAKNVDGMANRWKKEADEAIEKFGLTGWNS